MIQLIFLAISLLATTVAIAEPDKQSLLAHWESAMREQGVDLDRLDDGTYRLTDTELPYEGRVSIVGTNVRAAESVGPSGQPSYTGFVDFDLLDLPDRLRQSQLYYLWLAERQQYYYNDETQQWGSADEVWNAQTKGSAWQTFKRLLFRWGPLLILLFVVLVFIRVIRFVMRQQKNARALIDDSADINKTARENLERARELQEEHIKIARENAEVVKSNNELLREMLTVLRKSTR